MRQQPPQVHLLGSFLALGAIAILLQTLLLREFLVVFAGNELGLSLVFSGWLFGITLGALIGTILTRFLKNGFYGFSIVLCLLFIGSPLFLYLVRLIRNMADIPVGQYPPFFEMAAATFLLAAPAALPIGLVFPIAGFLAHQLEFGPKSIGSLYTFEAIGATLGGIGFTFLMAGRIDAFNSLAPFLLLGLATTIFLFQSLRRPWIHVPLSALALACATMLLFGGFTVLHQRSVLARWSSIAQGITLLESVDSRYQNLEVGRLEDQFSLYGNGEVFASFPDPASFQAEANLIACQHPAPKSALILGVGAEGLTRFLLSHGLSKLVYVETDPRAMELIDKYLPEEDREALRDARVSRVATDGRYYLLHTDQQFDLIILHLPDPSTAMINRFYTREFFLMIKDRLNPGGVFTFTLTSAVNVVGEQIGLYVGSIYNTARPIFSNIVILPEDAARFFLSSDPLACTDDWTALQERYRNRGLPEESFSTVLFKILMPKDRIEKFRHDLSSYEGARQNHDARPVTYFYNLLLWDQFSQGQLKPCLDILETISFTRIVFVLILGGGAALFLSLLFRSKRPAIALGWNAGVVIFSTGLAGMSLEFALLLAFQSAQGALYEKIGLFIALYMLGLAAGGGVATHRLGHRKIGLTRWILTTEILLLLLSLALARLISVALPGIVYFLLILLVGLLAGIQFPLAGALAWQRDGKVGSVAGLIDMADHLGAFAGAAVTGIFLIPLFGLSSTCLIIAVVKASSLLASLGIIGRTKQGGTIRSTFPL